MTPATIAILVFLGFMIFVMIAYRKSTLEKLEALPGEEILFEETEVTVDQTGAPEEVRFKWCVVRLTTMRVVIAQRLLFRKNAHALRFIVNYRTDALERQTDLKKTLLRGYLTLAIGPADLRVDTTTAGSAVRIAIPESALTRHQYIRYPTGKAEEYLKIFR